MLYLISQLSREVVTKPGSCREGTTGPRIPGPLTHALLSLYPVDVSRIEQHPEADDLGLRETRMWGNSQINQLFSTLSCSAHFP